MPLWLKRDYKAAAYVLTSCVLGLIFMRLIVYFAALPSETYGQTLGGNALFSLCSQLIFFLAIPFCIYKFYGKRTVKQTLEHSSIGRFKAYYLLALPLGIAVFFLTVGVSAAWTGLLRLTGYTVPQSSDNMPEKFVFGFLVADILLTAVLPAVCEEFSMRGGVLTTARRSFRSAFCIVLCAVIFGLFHQNIRQVFYTAMFGALAAYITLRTKSLYPAMIMHFANNFCSVYIDYAVNYDWAFGGLYTFLGAMPVWALTFVFLAVGLFAAAMVVLMMYFCDRRSPKGRFAIIDYDKADITNRTADGEAGESDVNNSESKREFYGNFEKLYKPTLRDVAVFIALGVVTLLTTVFTYVWGFFY
ncbi:MAG: CPBP family intramembrane metalloprotease [Clostridiales bacterium]|nr:CPBP family intramembrane metalloprotease [Clostridiales bacterium]